MAGTPIAGLCDGEPAPPAPDEAAAQQLKIKVAISATDADPSELIRMIGQSAGFRVVIPAIETDRIRVDLPEADLGRALTVVTEAAGLIWTLDGNTIVVDEATDGSQTMTVTAKVNGDGHVEAIQTTTNGPEWVPWTGAVPSELRQTAFEPAKAKINEARDELIGSLGDLVSDIEAAGLGVAMDPSLSEQVVNARISLPWVDGSTVEQAALRLGLAVAAGGMDALIVQHANDAESDTHRLRVVPAGRLHGLAPATRAHAIRAYKVIGAPEGLEGGAAPLAPVFIAPGGMGRILTVSAGADDDATPEPLKKRIDLALKDVQLSEALDAIAEKLGYPIEMDDDLGPQTTVSVSLRQAPIYRVLQTVLLQIGLSIEFEAGDEFDGVRVIRLSDPGGYTPIQPGARH